MTDAAPAAGPVTPPVGSEARDFRPVSWVRSLPFWMTLLTVAALGA